MAGQSKIGCITQRRFAKVGTKTHPQRGAALDRNGLSVSTETACRFEPKSPVGNSEICNYEVVRVSTGSSVQFENRVPRMLARNFVPGGTIDISYKDQELETSFAKHLGVPLLLANVTQQVYQMARAAGLNKEDGSSIIKVFERMAGVTIGGDDD